MATRRRVTRLATRARFYRVLAVLFEHPRQLALHGPSLPQLGKELQHAAMSLQSVPVLSETDAVCGALEQLATMGPAGAEGAFNVTFVPGALGYCPPYETEYVGEEVFAKTRELADIAGFYHAFQLRVSSKSGERVDHLSVELEFMALLLAKEGFAVVNGWPEQAEIARSAAQTFLQDHLAGWVPRFARTLEERAGASPYRALAGLLRAFLASEAKEFGVTAPPAPLTLPVLVPPAPMVCPADGAN